MKNKHCLAVMLAGAPVCFVLRLLQHLFIIDKDGFYTTTDMPHGLLIWALYGMFVLALLFAAVILFTGQKEQADVGIIQSAGSLGILYIAAAVLIMVHSGLSFVQPGDAPSLFARLLALSGVLSAVYFALLGIGTLKNNIHPAANLFGLFPPIYVCIYAVCEFYTSFETAQMSETVMATTSVCALLLFVTVICLTSAGAPVSKRRVAAVTTAYPIFASVTAPLFFMSPYDTATAIFSVIEIIFMLIAIIVMTRLNYVRPQPSAPVDVQAEAEPEPQGNDGLDKYMDQIPDEETEEETNE